MHILWSKHGHEDYLYWNKTDKRILKKINTLIQDISLHPFEGLGYPEPLKYKLSNYFWSRRINKKHRIVYTIKNGELIIIQCRRHY